MSQCHSGDQLQTQRGLSGDLLIVYCVCLHDYMYTASLLIIYIYIYIHVLARAQEDACDSTA